MQENREVSWRSWSSDQDRSAKAINRKADTNVQEKSDCAVIPVNQPNKERELSAVAGEGRAQTQENIGQSRSSDQGVLEISRFSCMLFLSVRGFSDYAGPTVHSRLAWLPFCLPPTRNEVGILIYGLFAALWPRPPVPLSTLQETPRDVPCKTRGQDGFATSFPVGLLHPLQHAGLSRRTPVCPSSGRRQGSAAAE